MRYFKHQIIVVLYMQTRDPNLIMEEFSWTWYVLYIVVLIGAEMARRSYRLCSQSIDTASANHVSVLQGLSVTLDSM